MKNRCKKGIAFLLAIAIIFTVIEYPMQLKAAYTSPAFPYYQQADEHMGAISDVKIGEKKIQISMEVSDTKVVLSLVFLKDGGVRLYDEHENNSMFSPKEDEIMPIHVVSHGNQELIAQSNETGVKISLDYSKQLWDMAIYTSTFETPIYTLSAFELLMSYESGSRQSVTLRGDISSEEKFIGLGERYSGLVLNGKTYQLWNADCWSQGTSSYVNVPLMHSNKGYSLFFNSYYAATVDVGDEDVYEYSFYFDGPDFDLYIWTGTPLENLKSYANLTGTSATIPEWAVGYWSGGASENYWYAQNEVDDKGNTTVYHSDLVLEDVLAHYEEMGTMPSAVYAESAPKNNARMYTIADNYETKLLGWWHANTPWTKDTNQKFSEKFMKDMLDGLSDVPAVKNADDSDYYTEGSNKWVHVDYTHRNVNLLLTKNLGEKSNVWSKGLDGFMVDYGEYIPIETTFANGKTGDEMHNLQAYYYNKAMKNAWDSYNPKDGYILFSRAGSSGSQQYAALFGGDQRSTFDGLTRALQGGISVGASGFSIWGSDIGGHQAETGIEQTEELYLRWLGLATFSPLMRAHGQTKNDPWDYDTEEGDTSAQDAFQKYYWLRENMREFIYSASIQSNKDGTPMMQAMGLAFAEEDGMFSVQDQYLFCDEILVAPVTEEGAMSRSVKLPTGVWYDLLTGEKVYGSGTDITVTAEQDETPAFIRSGAIVPMEISSDSWELADSMTDTNRTEILLLTPSEKDKTRTTTWWKNETENVSFTSTFDGETQTITATDGVKPIIMKMYDTVASHVYVDGVELDELYIMPTDEQCGYYLTEDGELFLVLPSEEWNEIQIETEGIWDYEFALVEPYEDVKYLDKAFDVYHYEYADNTKKPVESVLGPIAPSTIKPNSDPEVEYFTTQYYGSYSQGYLKPTAKSSGMAALSYKNSTFVNFEAEYEMLSTYSIFGLAFGGQEGVFPVSLDNKVINDTGVLLYMSNKGRVDIAGTIDTGKTSQSTVGITSYSANSKFAGAANIYTKAMAKTIDPISKPKATSETYTVCVRVDNGWLIVWEKSNPSVYAKVKLTNDYQGGYVSLISNETQHGAFKAFRIRSLDNQMSYQVDFEELSSLEAVDDVFTAYNIRSTDALTRTWDLDGDFKNLKNDFDTYYFDNRNVEPLKGTIDTYWFTEPNTKKSYAETKYANSYLKPMKKKEDSSGEGYTLLTLNNQKVDDFTAKLTYTTTFYEYGLMVAPARTVGKGSNGFKVYVNSDGQIVMTGMFDVTQTNWSGSGSLIKTTYTVQGPKLAEYLSPNDEAQQTYTLILSVKDGWVSASIEGFDGILKVKLKDNFVGDHISLYANGYAQGGFDQFELSVEKGDCLSMSGRPSSLWNRNLWSGNNMGTDAAYMQPNHKDKNKQYSFLTYEKETVVDFETEVVIANNYTQYGVSVAPAGEKFDSTNGVGVYADSNGKIHIVGAIHKNQATVTDDEGIYVSSSSNHIYTNKKLGLASPTNVNTKESVYTLCVKLQNNLLTAYVKENSDVQLSVPMTDVYQGGVLSLYSTGNNQGGFKSWTFNTYKRDTVTWEKGSQEDDVTYTLRTDFPYSHVAAIVNYDDSLCSYKYAIAQNGVVADVRVESDGILQVYLDCQNEKQKFENWVTLVFEANDRSSKISVDTRISNQATNVHYATNVYNSNGDINGDYYLDVRDLVRLKKYEMDAATEVMIDNCKLHSGVDIYSSENVLLLRKKLVTR